MVGVITFCIVVLTLFKTIEFCMVIVENKRSREAFDEFMKDRKDAFERTKENDLPFK